VKNVLINLQFAGISLMDIIIERIAIILHSFSFFFNILFFGTLDRVHKLLIALCKANHFISSISSTAAYLPGRTDVQCLHHWQKVLNPELVKGSWTKEVKINIFSCFGGQKE
jgi:hypothetical protein